jgi:hypothetical protein
MIYSSSSYQVDLDHQFSFSIIIWIFPQNHHFPSTFSTSRLPSSRQPRFVSIFQNQSSITWTFSTSHASIRIFFNHPSPSLFGSTTTTSNSTSWIIFKIKFRIRRFKRKPLFSQFFKPKLQRFPTTKIKPSFLSLICRKYHSFA